MRSALLVLSGLLVLLPIHAEEADAPKLTRGGADTCLACHEDSNDFPLMAIFQTPHGNQDDPHAPFGQLQCESCHGPGGDHDGLVRPGKEREPMPKFGPHATASTAEENQTCLNCHRGQSRAHWDGSTHQSADLSCADCHRIHAPRDPVLSSRTQTPVCTSCHQIQDAQLARASSHPLRSGEMTCSDCHAPHGGTQDALLAGHANNHVCSDCHADKRGPFLWEHAPVSEDCSLCHRPHGSNHPALLRQRPPLLCQQCHSAAGHPSLPHTSASAPSNMLSLRSCGNCHTQVHGSNHPSGAALMR